MKTLFHDLQKILDDTPAKRQGIGNWNKKVGIANLSEEQEKKRRLSLSKAMKETYRTNAKFRKMLDRTGCPPPNKVLDDYVGDWLLVQYERKRDVFGNKIGYQRLADCMGVAVMTPYNAIKKAKKRRDTK